MKLKNLLGRLLLCLMISVMLFTLAPIAAFADETDTATDSTTTIEPAPEAPVIDPSTQQGSTLNGTITDTGIEDVGSALPVTTTDDILNWATTKGNEIIYMLQIFCQPFAILIFIIAAFMTLIGCIGKGDMVGKGVWGMVMSVVVYAAVLYAPVILQTFVGWVAS